MCLSKSIAKCIKEKIRLKTIREILQNGNVMANTTVVYINKWISKYKRYLFFFSDMFFDWK
jgi:hypothetical protein